MVSFFNVIRIFILKETSIYWRFIKSDIWATIIPGAIATITALSHSSKTISENIVLFVASIIYFNLYVYTFVLSNQIGSVEEDRINKPFRPLPSGLVSKKGVKIRIVASLIIFIFYAFLLGVVHWAMLWVLVQLFHNIIGHKHWFTKNIISMSLGIFVLIGAGWEIVSIMSADQMKWSIIVSIILGTCGVIQDFRDIKGDKESGRQTLPINIGEMPGRFASVIICIISFIILQISVIRISLENPITILMDISILLIFVVIAYRILVYRTSKSDHKTYMILLYLFNLILLSGIVYL